MSFGMKINNCTKLTHQIPKPEPSECAPFPELLPLAVCIAKEAEVVMILDEWRAGRAKAQELIARIKKQAGPRDEIRLARLADEENKKRELEAEVKKKRREMRKAFKEHLKEREQMEREYRKDMRERTQSFNRTSVAFLEPVRSVRRSVRIATRQLAAMTLGEKEPAEQELAQIKMEELDSIAQP
ncbi:MAG: hypothetical protein Q9195_009435 [Heterodermia aff. obscurata]